jgi:hypothetical protein
MFQCKARVWSDDHRLGSEETKSAGRASGEKQFFCFSCKYARKNSVSQSVFACALWSIDPIPPQLFAQFPRMLIALEEAKAALGILSYGLSVTTLEDVFLRVAANEEKHHHHHSSSSSDDADSAPAAMAVSAAGALRFSQAQSGLVMRAINSHRKIANIFSILTHFCNAFFGVDYSRCAQFVSRKV